MLKTSIYGAKVGAAQLIRRLTWLIRQSYLLDTYSNTRSVPIGSRTVIRKKAVNTAINRKSDLAWRRMGEVKMAFCGVSLWPLMLRS